MSDVDAVSLTMTSAPERIVQTGALDEEALASAQNCRDAWQEIIDETLVEWGRHPELVEEDDLIPPSARAVQTACRVAMAYRDHVKPPPKRVVPDGDGGIVFERWSGSVSESLEVACDGQLEYVSCHNGVVVGRRPVTVDGHSSNVGHRG